MKHLLLIGAMFVLLPLLKRPSEAVRIWKCLFVTGTIGSCTLIANFLYRLVHYRRELSAAGGASLYLRTGGALHHWMIYATVEVLIFAGFIEFWSLFSEKRRLLVPLIGINCIAICFSLTRMLWLAVLVMLAFHLARQRSKWIWALPFVPLVSFALAPGAVRSRVIESVKPGYYSNTERLQMLRVGWRMILDAPLTGVGPGRVQELYTRYLTAGAPVPAYHGHLHNNLVQVMAEFGMPVALSAVFFLAMLWIALWRVYKSDIGREIQFLTRTSLSALVGFLTAGLFEYTYGHSLGIILLSFTALTPVIIAERYKKKSDDHRPRHVEP